MLFIGCRVGEVLRLRWHDLDFERGNACIFDTKT
jgi:integrase